MSRKAEKTSPRSQQQSRWSIFFRNALLLKIVVGLGSLSIIVSTGGAWANFKPVVSTSPPEARAIVQFSPCSSPDTIVVKSADWQADLETDRRKSPIQITPSDPAVKPSSRRPSQVSPSVAAGKIVRPQHTNLLTADNYLVGVHGSDAQPKIAKESIDIHVPAPLQTTIPDRPRATVTIAKSRIEPSYIKTRSAIDRSVPATSLLSKFSPQQSIDKPAETLPEVCLQSSDISPASQLLQITPSNTVPAVPSKPGIRPPLAFSQSKPIAFANNNANKRTSKNSWEVERLATISDLKITDPSFRKNPQTPPDLPKQKISLATDTQMTVGVKVLEANDFADTIHPLIDGREDNGVSRFGSRPGIYYLVAGSGVGVRHQFSSSLEGSVGLLVRSSSDKPQNSQSGGSLGNEKATANNTVENGNKSVSDLLEGGSLTSSYGTIAQLTYAPSENVKFGVTYVYGYKVIPEIGSENANQTEGSNNALGFQTFLRLDPNLAVGGWVGFNQNSDTELNKNILTWAVTAAIPDLGGKGNLAGIVVGQEPRVVAASKFEAQDSGSSWHLEGFYQIKISDDLSIVPAIVYLTGSNIDNVKSDSGDFVGTIGINFKF